LSTENITQIKPTVSNSITSNNSTIEKTSSNNDSLFTIGIGIGIGVGVAIGIVLFLIFRQKPNK
jgi:tetrahydromethanopterin S-methyltransferase subunit G